MTGKTDNRQQLGYGSAWHMQRVLGVQRSRFSVHVADLVARETDQTVDGVDWLDFPAYAGNQSHPGSHPILDGEWTRLDFIDNPGVQEEYNNFWPTTGSQQSWDAIGKIDIGGQSEWLLVEAKAHTSEIKSSGTGAGATSRTKIEAAFEKTQERLGAVVPVTNWLDGYYQNANRLATLYFLNCVVGVPARLLLIYFCDDSYTGKECPADASGWQKSIKNVDESLGLTGSSDLERRVHQLFLPVNLAV